MFWAGIRRGSGSHQRRWSAETIAQVRLRPLTAIARVRVWSKRDGPGRSEQNCFGIEAPGAIVVRLLNRDPSPAANTTVHVEDMFIWKKIRPRHNATSHFSW